MDVESPVVDAQNQEAGPGRARRRGAWAVDEDRCAVAWKPPHVQPLPTSGRAFCTGGSWSRRHFGASDHAEGAVDQVFLYAVCMRQLRMGCRKSVS